MAGASLGPLAGPPSRADGDDLRELRRRHGACVDRERQRSGGGDAAIRAEADHGDLGGASSGDVGGLNRGRQGRRALVGGGARAAVPINHGLRDEIRSGDGESERYAARGGIGGRDRSDRRSRGRSGRNHEIDRRRGAAATAVTVTAAVPAFATSVAVICACQRVGVNKVVVRELPFQSTVEPDE